MRCVLNIIMPHVKTIPQEQEEGGGAQFDSTHTSSNYDLCHNYILDNSRVQIVLSYTDSCPRKQSVEFRRVCRQARISNTKPAATRVVTSPLRCATHCASHPECTAFDFSHRYHHCHLHGYTSAIETTDDIDFSVFELVP